MSGRRPARRYLSVTWPILLAVAAVSLHRTPALADGLPAAQNAAPPLIERAALLRKPALRILRLSPSGRQLAYAVADGARLRLRLRELPAGADRLITSSTKLEDLRWSRDGTVLYLEMHNAVGYLSAAASRPPGYLARFEPGEAYLLGPDDSAAAGYLLVRRDDAHRFLLERVLPDREPRTVLGDRSRIAQALSSRDGRTLVVKLESLNGSRVERLSAATGKREPLFDCVPGDPCHLVALGPATATLWFQSSRGRDLQGLYAFDMKSRSLRKMHEDPQGIADLVFVPQGRVPSVVAYDGRMRSYFAIAPRLSAPLTWLQTRFRGSELDLEVADDGGAMLVRQSAATLAHPRFFLFDTASRNLEPLLDEVRDRTPAPREERLTRKTFTSYRGSDGYPLYGYVTLPAAGDPSRLPLVALVHGGPVSRANGGYSPLVQLLANRGYAVFEPNFRGSTGHGLEYVRAANKDWGDGRVLQDVIDGIDYLLGRGIGDGDRMAIAGASFGGFAALSGLAFAGERFRAGIAIIAPADLGVSAREMLEGDVERDQPLRATLRRRWLVDPDDPDEMARLYAQSPMAHLDAISAPLLVVAGANDDRVPIGHVKSYALALANGGKDVDLLIDEDMGHGTDDRTALLANLYLVEAFLARHLGGRVQPLEDPDVRAYLDTNRQLTRRSTPGAP